MQIQINKEIRDYYESMFFGLSARQFFFSLAAVATSVLTYFISVNKLGNEVTSWLCIVASVPFIALGYIRYNGMYFESFVIAVFRFLLTPSRLTFTSENLFYSMMKDQIKRKKKEVVKNNDQISEEDGKRL